MDSRILLHSDTTHWMISPYAYFNVKAEEALSLMETISY